MKRNIIDEEKRQRVIDLREQGMTYQEISDAIGYKGTAWICKVCNESGVGGTSAWKEKRYEEWREYKREGHTMKEVAERFGISEGTAQQVCRGISPQKSVCKGESPSFIKNQYTSGTFDREGNAKRLVEERTPSFEYVGGFTDSEGTVEIRCEVCGHIQTRSLISIRHRTAKCDKCREQEAKEKQEEELQANEQRKKERDRSRKEKEARKREEKERKNEEREARRHPCPICGRSTTNKFCCSTECANKRNNQLKETRRRAKVTNALVDRGITLQRLFDRDRGECYICGQPCEWEDKEERAECIVCGDNYPSIDHIVPLSAGGRHEWANVRLAHRRCNAIKGAKYIPLVQ